MCCMSETRLGQFTYEMGRFNTAAPLRTDCYQTPTIKFIVPCLQKQGHLIFKGLHQVAQYHAAQPRAAGFQLEGFAWREAVITRALPEVSLLVFPSDDWRVLPADLQVYPPIWRAGGWLIHWPWAYVASSLEALVHFVPVVISSWHFQEWLPMRVVMSMQKIKIRGQRWRSQR